MSECPFCAAGKRKWLENNAAIAFPDAYPIAEGHTLIVPRVHVSSLYELNTEQQSSMWDLVAEVRQGLLVGLKPDAFNIGVNDGIAAGQTVDHAHVDVIPRIAERYPLTDALQADERVASAKGKLCFGRRSGSAEWRNGSG